VVLHLLLSMGGCASAPVEASPSEGDGGGGGGTDSTMVLINKIATSWYVEMRGGGRG